MKSKQIGLIAAPFLFLVVASTALAGLPDPGMQVDAKTALVITDPQNDFLSPDGVTWGVVGESVTANKHRAQHRNAAQDSQGARPPGLRLASLLLPD